MPDRIREYRARLLKILSELDQMESGAQSIMAEPVFGDINDSAEDMRELHVELSALVEE